MNERQLLDAFKNVKAEEHPLSQKPLIERITPGPWTSVKRYSRCFEIKSNGAEVARVTLQATGNVINHANEVAEANAEAISRVPELLKAEQELKEAQLLNDRYDLMLDDFAKDVTEKNAKIQELEETISHLKQELKEERNPGVDINYDLHEGRGEGNEML